MTTQSILTNHAVGVDVLRREKILEDESYDSPAGEALLASYKQRPDKIRVMEARLAKKHGRTPNHGDRDS